MTSPKFLFQVRQQAFTDSSLAKVTLDCMKNEGVSTKIWPVVLVSRNCISCYCYFRSGAFSRACIILYCQPVLWIPSSLVFTVYHCASWPRCVQMPKARPRRPRPQSNQPTGRFFGPVVPEGLHNWSLRVLSMWPRSNFKHRQVSKQA